MTAGAHIAVVMELQCPYPRHYEVFAGIQEYAGTHGNWRFDLGNYPELAIAEGRRFDGIIGRISRDCHAAARKAGIPVVNVWMDSPVASRVPGVHPDFRAAGRLTAEHLVARGLRRLAHFGYTGTLSSKLHFEGMAEHAGGTLSVNRIAASVGLGRQALERRFRRHVGRTINDEWIRLRVSKLKRLLVQSGQTVSALSAQAGFGTTVSMYTMFKRLTGMTPETYRQRHGPRQEPDELGI
jgi:AraC-like DNA-binding protein